MLYKSTNTCVFVGGKLSFLWYTVWSLVLWQLMTTTTRPGYFQISFDVKEFWIEVPVPNHF